MDYYNPNSFFVGTAIVIGVAALIYIDKDDSRPKQNKDLKGAYPHSDFGYAHAATDFIEALNSVTSVFACRDKMEVKDRDEFIKSQHN